MITLVQHAGNNSVATATTQALSFGSPNQAGNTLLAFGITNNLGGLAASLSIADSLNNNWRVAVLQSNLAPFNLLLGMFYCLSCKAGANTVTLTSNYANTGLREIVEVSGAPLLDAVAPVYSQVGSVSLTLNYNGLLATDFIFTGVWTFSQSGGLASVTPSPPFQLLDAAGGSPYSGTTYMIGSPRNLTEIVSAAASTSGGWLAAVMGVGSSSGSWMAGERDVTNKHGVWEDWGDGVMP